MKKFTFIALAITAVLGVTSCTEKEGEYSPKMKMDKLYEIENGQQVLAGVFHWDGDKLVSISDDESTIYTITYDDKGRIATINASGEEMIYTYTYDGKKLSKITGNSDYASVSLDFTHDGKKISSMKVTYTFDYDWDFKGTNFNFASHALGMMMPSPICKNIDAMGYRTVQKAKANGFKGTTYTFDVNFTWDGKNISRVDMGETESTTYEYDKNPSPYFNLLLGSFMMGDPADALSTNNVTRTVTTYSDSKESYTSTYTYEYGEKNYPTKVIYTSDSYSDTSLITYL